MVSRMSVVVLATLALLLTGASAFVVSPTLTVGGTGHLDTPLARRAHKVTIQHEGKETVMEVEDGTSILEAALDNGIELPHDCKLGVCMTCPSRVVSGEVDQSDGTLEDSVVAQGYALTCVTYAKSDCVIKSIDEDELVSAQFER